MKRKSNTGIDLKPVLIAGGIFTSVNHLHTLKDIDIWKLELLYFDENISTLSTQISILLK